MRQEWKYQRYIKGCIWQTHINASSVFFEDDEAYDDVDDCEGKDEVEDKADAEENVDDGDGMKVGGRNQCCVESEPLKGLRAVFKIISVSFRMDLPASASSSNRSILLM